MRGLLQAFITEHFEARLLLGQSEAHVRSKRQACQPLRLYDHHGQEVTKGSTYFRAILASLGKASSKLAQNSSLLTALNFNLKIVNFLFDQLILQWIFLIQPIHQAISQMGSESKRWHWSLGNNCQMCLAGTWMFFDIPNKMRNQIFIHININKMLKEFGEVEEHS